MQGRVRVVVGDVGEKNNHGKSGLEVTPGGH